ncbi:MAG: phage morphogenesis protein [Pseudomonadota bacterium]
MAESKSLVWKGAAVTERMRKAQIVGVNDTMSACVVTSKRNHDWRYRNGALEGGIGIAVPAAPDGHGVRGTWGVQDVNYARIHELGGTITPKTAKALAIPLPDGGVAFAASVTIPARPYLRPSADTNYPSLPDRIRKAYDSGGGEGGGNG